jgi:DnaJ-class molecular chaperone
LKWHPKLSNADPNTAYSNFCKVSEAYEVLSDGNDVIIKMKEE